MTIINHCKTFLHEVTANNEPHKLQPNSCFGNGDREDGNKTNTETCGSTNLHLVKYQGHH